MSELADFLEARLAEDEAVARAAVGRNGADWSVVCLEGDEGTDDLWGYRIEGTSAKGNPHAYGGSTELWDDEGALGMWRPTAEHVARHDPARVLREVTAKRAILDAVKSGFYDSDLEVALRALALPFSDHPDFQEQWR